MKVMELLSSPARWTKLTCFRDSCGLPCSPEQAKSYCLLGALSVCYSDKDSYIEALDKVRKLIGGSTIQGFNDSSSYEQVLALVQEAGV